jgi:hypothetical protein
VIMTHGVRSLLAFSLVAATARLVSPDSAAAQVATPDQMAMPRIEYDETGPEAEEVCRALLGRGNTRWVRANYYGDHADQFSVGTPTGWEKPVWNVVVNEFPITISEASFDLIGNGSQRTFRADWANDRRWWHSYISAAPGEEDHARTQLRGIVTDYFQGDQQAWHDFERAPGSIVPDRYAGSYTESESHGASISSLLSRHPWTCRGGNFSGAT